MREVIEAQKLIDKCASWDCQLTFVNGHVYIKTPEGNELSLGVDNFEQAEGFVYGFINTIIYAHNHSEEFQALIESLKVGES